MKDITENNIQSTETVALEEMTKEQLIDLIYQMADADDSTCEESCHCHDCDDDDIGDIVDPVVGFNLENVIDSQFDAKEFDKGIKSMSFVAGQLMALQNAGITAQNALEYLHAVHVQDSDCECTKKIAEIQTNLSKEVEKKNLIESKKNIA